MTDTHSLRDDMSMPTEFAVCDALIDRAVMGDAATAKRAIRALYELGFAECAAHLDDALSYRRELLPPTEDHSVRVESLVERVRAYAPDSTDDWPVAS